MYWENIEYLEVEKAEAQRRSAIQEKASVELPTRVNTEENKGLTPTVCDVPMLFSAVTYLRSLGRWLVA